MLKLHHDWHRLSYMYTCSPGSLTKGQDLANHWHTATYHTLQWQGKPSDLELYS